MDPAVQERPIEPATTAAPRSEACPETGSAARPAADPAPSSSPTNSSSLGLAAAALLPLGLVACGGGDGETTPPESQPLPPVPATDPGSGAVMAAYLPGSGDPAPTDTRPRPSLRDAARFLTQATFGIRSVEEVQALAAEGFETWLWREFNAPTLLHTSYLERALLREPDKAQYNYVPDFWSYEAVWQQWLATTGQLRARVAFALSQIFVISNVAPDLKAQAMSSYMDMLNRNAFGNYRALLGDVTLHPAMGHFLNMLRSRKADTAKGTHPNENYAREVLQLFSIGQVQLNPDGTPKLDGSGKPIPTYDESVVKGFAAAFTGWSFGGQGNGDAALFYKADWHNAANWTTPMAPFASQHQGGTKMLLNGATLAGGEAVRDLNAALDNIFQHPNVGPFIGRQLIQRLVTSNPSPAYIARVSAVFADNGRGVRGDLKAVVRAILLDPEARGDDAAQRARFGKLREPVIRLTSLLRALGARSSSGLHLIHSTASPDDGLGQSPLLAPSVFNFFSPAYRPAGPLADAGMAAPEFQIHNEATAAASLNFLAGVIHNKGIGWMEERRLRLDLAPLVALAGNPAQLVERLDLLFCNAQMSTSLRNRLLALIGAIPQQQGERRVKSALILCIAAPDFAVQK